MEINIKPSEAILFVSPTSLFSFLPQVMKAILHLQITNRAASECE